MTTTAVNGRLRTFETYLKLAKKLADLPRGRSILEGESAEYKTWREFERDVVEGLGEIGFSSVLFGHLVRFGHEGLEKDPAKGRLHAAIAREARRSPYR